MTAGRSVFREYFEALLIAGVFLGFANTFVLKTFYIPSSSMENTLLVGDHLFVNRFIYGTPATALERTLLPTRAVQRGDIVIFRSLENPETDMVKRCVGLGGDTVELRSAQLYVNGAAVDDGAVVIHKNPPLPGDDPYRLEQKLRRDNFGPL